MSSMDATTTFLSAFVGAEPTFPGDDCVDEFMTIALWDAVFDGDEHALPGLLQSLLWLLQHDADSTAFAMQPKWMWLVDRLRDIVAANEDKFDESAGQLVDQLVDRILAASPEPEVAASTLTTTVSGMMERLAALIFSGTEEETEKTCATGKNTPEAKTYVCQVCFDREPEEKGFKLEGCGHIFCRECFTGYITSKVRDAHVYPTCFHTKINDGREEACSAAVTENDIRALVSPEDWIKYETFKFSKENENARQCPFCGHLQVCASAQVDPKCLCHHCNRVFCFFHANAHSERIKCATYERRIARAEKRTKRILNKHTKPCPNCGARIEKNGGCNHMHCAACRTDFCWLCGKAMDSVADHYSWRNVSECSGQQHVNLVARPSWWSRILGLVVAALAWCLVCLLTLVVVILSCFCVPCWMLNSSGDFDDLMSCAHDFASLVVYGTVEVFAAACRYLGTLLSVVFCVPCFKWLRNRAECWDTLDTTTGAETPGLAHSNPVPDAFDAMEAGLNVDTTAHAPTPTSNYASIS
ncbi:hypothetical protein PINS_up006205 [Pythium insidiosum]|nr:hypothetical protein PINS_up006205 [Pythium insidiosum]